MTLSLPGAFSFSSFDGRKTRGCVCELGSDTVITDQRYSEIHNSVGRKLGACVCDQHWHGEEVLSVRLWGMGGES